MVKTITFYIRHFRARWFRGPVVGVKDSRGGQVITYRSGYVEFVVKGQRYDAALCERAGRIPWYVAATQGRGIFYTPPMTQQQAEKYVSEISGAVIWVDPGSGVIFTRAEK